MSAAYPQEKKKAGESEWVEILSGVSAYYSESLEFLHRPPTRTRIDDPV